MNVCVVVLKQNIKVIFKYNLPWNVWFQNIPDKLKFLQYIIWPFENCANLGGWKYDVNIECICLPVTLGKFSVAFVLPALAY